MEASIATAAKRFLTGIFSINTRLDRRTNPPQELRGAWRAQYTHLLQAFVVYAEWCFGDEGGRMAWGIEVVL